MIYLGLEMLLLHFCHTSDSNVFLKPLAVRWIQKPARNRIVRFCNFAWSEKPEGMFSLPVLPGARSARIGDNIQAF